jgi:DNA polymerase-4
MPSATALRLCPQIIFVRPRFEAYKEVSRQIREIFESYTDLVEPLSLDEAYLDVTENKFGISSALAIAKQIKEKIQLQTRLTGTAGVSYNKFLAKMASGYKKPDGLNFIPPEKAQEFIDQLPISQFYGIGAKTTEKMLALGIQRGYDLRQHDIKFLIRHFGKAGRYYHDIANGLDDRKVTPERPMKSVSVEDTFPDDLLQLPLLDAELEKLSITLQSRMQRYEVRARTLSIKVKFDDFQQITRSTSIASGYLDLAEILTLAQSLLRKTEAGQRPIRLLGIGLSNFLDQMPEPEGKQLKIPFEDLPD